MTALLKSHSFSTRHLRKGGRNGVRLRRAEERGQGHLSRLLPFAPLQVHVGGLGNSHDRFILQQTHKHKITAETRTPYTFRHTQTVQPDLSVWEGGLRLEGGSGSSSTASCSRGRRLRLSEGRGGREGWVLLEQRLLLEGSLGRRLLNGALLQRLLVGRLGRHHRLLLETGQLLMSYLERKSHHHICSYYIQSHVYPNGKPYP